MYNQDCMVAMAGFDDNQFDLAIVDPPYGWGNKYNFRFHDDDTKETYDNVRPTKEYFKQLLRISKEQIVWGGNYFTNDLPENRGWICWDKKQPLEGTSFSHFELAWTSFDKNAVQIDYRYYGNLQGNTSAEKKIHPTQKPVKVLERLIEIFTDPGEVVIDPVAGSGTTLLAAMTRAAKFIEDPNLRKILELKDKDNSAESGSIGTEATRAGILDKIAKLNKEKEWSNVLADGKNRLKNYVKRILKLKLQH